MTPGVSRESIKIGGILTEVRTTTLGRPLPLIAS